MGLPYLTGVNVPLGVFRVVCVGIFLNLHCIGPVTTQAHLRIIGSPVLFLFWLLFLAWLVLSALLSERGSVLYLVLLPLSVLIVGYGAGPVLRSSDHWKLVC